MGWAGGREGIVGRMGWWEEGDFGWDGVVEERNFRVLGWKVEDGGWVCEG